MNFDFSEDQKLLQRTARDFLREHAPLAAVRAVLEGGHDHDQRLWRGVAEMRWPGTAIAEAYGGSGFGHLELAVLAHELGRALAPIPFASSVYLAAEAVGLAGSEAQRRRWLPKLADGSVIGTAVLDEGAGVLHVDGTRVSGTLLPVPDVGAAGLAVVASGPSLVLVDLTGPGVTRERVASFDPSRPVGRLVLEGAVCEPLGAADEGAAARILDRAATLVAFEQIGGAERALELTREYVLQRYAFGRPIGSFQALKHRLADTWVAIELARSNAYWAAWALASGSPELGTAACAARVAATDAFRLAAREMIQFHGGMGFTWESDCHLFYRRAEALGLGLGSARVWRERLVRRIAA
jgi:acyl-CoA dehydrogenase